MTTQSSPLDAGQHTTELLGCAAGTALQVAVAVLSVLHPGFTITPDLRAALLAEAGFVTSAAWGFYTHLRTKLKLAAISSTGGTILTQSALAPAVTVRGPSASEVLAALREAFTQSAQIAPVQQGIASAADVPAATTQTVQTTTVPAQAA